MVKYGLVKFLVPRVRSWNRLHSIAAVAIVLLFALAGTKAGAQTPADVKGWANTRWGMTREEIQGLYPNAATFFNGLRIPEYQALDIQWGVLFLFEGKGLVEVQLGATSLPRSTRAEFAATCSKLTEILSQKYGTRTETKTPEAGKKVVIWSMPSTVVELTEIEFNLAQANPDLVINQIHVHFRSAEAVSRAKEADKF